MPANPMTFYGHDCSGLEAALLTAPNLLNADAGNWYFATDTKQVWFCQGNGIWQPVGGGGGVAPGGAGSNRSVMKLLTGMADATFVDVATITVPNAIMGGGLRVTAMGVLGDGDSSQMTQFHGAIARIPGAATGVTFAAAVVAATKAGVNSAALAIQASAITGAIGAQQSFTVQLKVTKSAGASTGHVVVASVELLNAFSPGITIA